MLKLIPPPLLRRLAAPQAGLRGSLFFSGGLVIARALGLLYGLVLARALHPAGYGYVQYNIALANLLALLTIPFGQHIIARSIAVSMDDDEVRTDKINRLLATQVIIFLATLALSTPILLLVGRFNLGTLVIFVGVTAFYTYYGLARGFLANERLVTVFLGSNLVQIVLTALVYTVFDQQNPLPALLIYGLSYFPLLIGVSLWWPLAMRFRPQIPSRAELGELLRFALPVWFGHIAYILFTTVDILLLEHYTDAHTVGIYALAKQLSMIFILNSMGISTVLMPQIARSNGSQAGLVRAAFVNYLLLSVVIFIPFVLFYNAGATLIGGIDYVTPDEVYVLVALTVIMQGAHTVAEAILMGRGWNIQSTLARASGLLVAVVLGLMLAPRHGLIGVALALCVAALVALIAFGIVLILSARARSASSVSAQP